MSIHRTIGPMRQEMAICDCFDDLVELVVFHPESLQRWPGTHVSSGFVTEWSRDESCGKFVLNTEDYTGFITFDHGSATQVFIEETPTAGVEPSKGE